MNQILDFLGRRNSAPRLTEPAPAGAQLEAIIGAAMRAPDHARLRPWRFIAISGRRREAFGELLRTCLLERDPGADAAAQEKAQKSPLRAPLLIAVVVCLKTHPKVPPAEQRMSAACAAHGLLLAAESLGFAGIWRTGEAAFDRRVMSGLGLAADEELAGFIYLGTRQGPPKPLPELDPGAFLSAW